MIVYNKSYVEGKTKQKIKEKKTFVSMNNLITGMSLLPRERVNTCKFSILSYHGNGLYIRACMKNLENLGVIQKNNIIMPQNGLHLINLVALY